ncbi:glycosyltransferase family 2 protein [Streptomyces aureus]
MQSQPQQPSQQRSQVSVVVIGYNDAAQVTDAVRSALSQGPAVREVIAVDDCSTDGSGELLQRMADEEPRLKVVRRATNSGGCGTPRNDGIDSASAPYVMFLDSDDVLPPGAVDALLGAALTHRTEVAAGLCVRRELPRAATSRGSPSCTPTPPWSPTRNAAPASSTTRSASTSSTARTSCASTGSASLTATSSTRTSSSSRACSPPHRASRSSPTRSTSGTCAATPAACRSPSTGPDSTTGPPASRRTASPSTSS